jgi:hypothetical protein
MFSMLLPMDFQNRSMSPSEHPDEQRCRHAAHVPVVRSAAVGVLRVRAFVLRQRGTSARDARWSLV